MSNNCETIADIADEMHYGLVPKHWTDHGLLTLYADRIEDAYKREKLRLATANGELARMLDLGKAQHGNAAAMREALEMMCSLFAKGVICTSYANTPEEMEQIEELYRKAKAALAAPPKNCDNYDNKTDAEIGFREETEECEKNPLYWQLFANWLFATAAERKGDNDGR